MYVFPLRRKRCGVKVERINKKEHKYKVTDVCIIGEDTPMTDLPDNFQIVDAEGAEIKPTGRFLMTAETIDPYHIVVDMF